MPNTFNDKQKSLKRRFLLILGLITFVCFLGFGLLVIFNDNIATALPTYQRRLLGGAIIIYSVLRFSRLLKKDKDE